MLFFTKLAKMAIKISKSNLQSSKLSVLSDQPKEINWLLIFYTKKTTTKKTSKFPNMTVHSQWNGSPGTPALQVDCETLSRVLWFAECSWWDGADTTLTIWSQRSGRRPTAHQRQSWALRKRSSGSSKRSDPSRQQPAESAALFSATQSSGRINIPAHCRRVCVCSCRVITFVFFSKFINMMMKHGNKVLAREILTQVRKQTLSPVKLKSLLLAL